MGEEEKIMQTIRHFVESSLLERDVEKTLEVVSDDVLGIGLNEQGTVSSKEEVRALLSSQKYSDAIDYQISYPRTDIRYHPPGFATARVVYELNYVIDGKHCRNAFIQTAAAKKEDGAWKLCLLQAIPVELTEESIENYPLKFADQTLANLRSELERDSFRFLSHSLSIGILGSYVDGGDLPPFYVNDNLLNMLGYTQEEFFQLMKGDSFAVLHPEDKQRVQEELAKASLSGNEYECRYRLQDKQGGVHWIVEYGKLSVSGGRQIALSAFVEITELMQLQAALREQNQTILSSIAYASKIQRNLLPPEASFQKAFSDYSILWHPKDIVSGDLYWLRTFRHGSLLCVGDCTGHGTPGALLTMLAASSLETLADGWNCQKPARILALLDRRMSEVLNVHTQGIPCQNEITHIHDGCDMAVLFIAADGSVTISSAGIHVFICDGRSVRQIKGQKLHLGEGGLHEDAVHAVHVPYSPDNVFYIASDGLYDQIGGTPPLPFGYRAFRDIVLENHSLKQQAVSEKVWEAFEAHRGGNLRRDDVELISFRPSRG